MHPSRWQGDQPGDPAGLIIRDPDGEIFKAIKEAKAAGRPVTIKSVRYKNE